MKTNHATPDLQTYGAAVEEFCRGTNIASPEIRYNTETGEFSLRSSLVPYDKNEITFARDLTLDAFLPDDDPDDYAEGEIAAMVVDCYGNDVLRDVAELHETRKNQ